MADDDLGRAIGERIVGRSQFTADEVEAATAVPVGDAERLWTELGFAAIERSERFFTPADVEVLKTLQALQSTGLVSRETSIAGARVLGQALARVATAQAQNISGAMAEGPGDEETLLATLERVLPMFDTFISYVWRRHLAAAVARQFDDRPTEVVGFADIVGYTQLTADMEDAAISELVTRFQELATEHVGAERGRVLKGIGDAVMFVAPDPGSAARAALALSGSAHDDAALPEVRIGLATGPVVEIEGDIYGETVNRASRLVELAHPGTIVVDDETGAALFDSDLRVRPMRPRKLKGLGPVATWVVRPPRPPRGDRPDGA